MRRIGNGDNDCESTDSPASTEQTGSENTDPKKKHSSAGVDYKLIDDFLKWVYKPLPNWRGSSSSVTTNQDNQDWYFTTLMIHNPEIAKEFLDCFIIKKTDGKTAIMDYTMIHVSFKPDTEDMRGSGSNAQETNKNIITKEDHPLMKVLTRKQENTDKQQQYQEIMDHPLVRGYVRREWSRIKRRLLPVVLLPYLSFLIVYSICIVTTNPRSSNKSLWNEELPCLPQEGENTLVSLMICVIIFAAILICKEIIEIFTYGPKSYFTSYANYCELFTYVSSIVFAAMNFHSTCNSVVQDIQWFIGVISIFVAWFNLLSYVKRIDMLGVYVMMFEKVVWKFIRVVCVFLFIFIGGFGIVFYSLLHENQSFGTIALAFSSTAAMIAGEVEYSSKLIEDRPHFLILSCIFIILFIVLVPILIMNLLVAAIVDGFQDIQKSADAEKIELQTMLIIRFEYFVWNCKCMKCLRQCLNPVEEIRLDKKSETCRLPVDAIHSILKEQQKDVVGTVQLNNRLNHIENKLGKLLDTLENIQKNGNGSN